MTVAISWSGLRRFEECRYRHKLVISGKKDVDQDTRNFLPGTVADRIMRRWLEQDDPRPGQMASWVDEHFRYHTETNVEGKIRWRGANDKEIVRNTILEAVTNLEPILIERILPTEYEPEMRFRTHVQIPGLSGEPWDIILVGGIDIASRHQPGEARLDDLKVTRNADYASKVQGQMVFYSLCFEYLTGIPVTDTALIMPLLEPHRRVRPVTITDEIKQDMLKRIVDMAHAIWRREWTMPDTRTPCQRCEVKPHCPRYAVPSAPAAKGRKTAPLGLAAKLRSEAAEPVLTTDPIGCLLGIPATGEDPSISRVAPLARKTPHE